MGPKKLADILLECAATHKDVKKELTVIVAGQTGPAFRIVRNTKRKQHNPLSELG